MYQVYLCFTPQGAGFPKTSAVADPQGTMQISPFVALTVSLSRHLGQRIERQLIVGVEEGRGALTQMITRK